MANTRWDASRIPQLDGRIVIVTGANSGLGWRTAAALADKGAHVVMACRNQAKAQTAAGQIRALHPKASLEIRSLDLADLKSVGAFAKDYRKDHKTIDLLINNAGVMFAPRGKTADGFEIHFGSNYLGPFALTGQLLDLVEAAPAGRVVTVASEFSRFGRIRLDDLNAERSYSRVWAYANSKLANLMFALELARRLEAKGSKVISVAAHPGYSATNLQAAGVQMGRPDALARFGDWSMKILNSTVAQSAEMGALPTLRAATADDVKGGDYYGPDGFQGLTGWPDHARKTPQALNRDKARRLWEASEVLTGVSYA